MRIHSLRRALLVGTTVLLLAACNKDETPVATEDPVPPTPTLTAQRYDVESGILTYEIQSDFLTGTETVYFEDYGRIEAKETVLQINIGDTAEEQRQLTILRDGAVYSIDLNTKAGTRIPDEMSDRIDEAVEAAPGAGRGEAIMALMGGTQTGTDTALGFECQLWEIAELGSVSCMYQGVPLTANADFGGITLSYTATAAEFDVDVPDDKFEIPADITVTDAPPLGTVVPEFEE